MNNVAFCGKAGSGKSILTQHLCKKYGYTHAKMATSVYAIAQQYFGMTNKNRKLLQTIGSDVGREEYSKNIWVERFLQDTELVKRTNELLYSKGTYFCADDIRFKNEAQVLIEEGWKIFYLNVDDKTRISRLGNRDGDAQINTLNHSSETEIDEFKDSLIQIDASGTVEQAIQQLEKYLFVKEEKNESQVP